MPQHKTIVDRRQNLRFDTKFRAVLIESDVFGERVEIVNIGRTGFLARTHLSRESGEEISLHLSTLGRANATIVWCANGLIGGRFRDAIDERSFADLIDSSPRPDQRDGAISFKEIEGDPRGLPPRALQPAVTVHKQTGIIGGGCDQ